MIKPSIFNQTCVTDDTGKGFKCGGCSGITGITLQDTSLGQAAYTINCTNCSDGYSLTQTNLTATLNTTGTIKKSISKCDMSVYCYQLPPEPEPSSNMVAILVVVFFAVLAFGCCICMVIFFFKRKPPMLVKEPKWPEDPNTSGMDNLRNNEVPTPNAGDISSMPMNMASPTKGGKMTNFGDSGNQRQINRTPENPPSPENPTTSKAKTLRKRAVKGDS